MIDLVAPLELLGVELAERSFEAPMDVLGLLGVGRREDRSGQAQKGGQDQRFAEHRAQPFFASSPVRTGVEMDSGMGSGVSRQPVIGTISTK